MSDPLISVIIMAYNRREFIREAVKSVVNQTLPKDEYELIVVKNFEDAYVDDVIKSMKGKSLKGKSLLADLISYGAKVTLAIEKAEGDVICFLDDDDMYSPWRLEVIRDKFKHNPSLIYYHNNVLVVNELGKPILDSSIEKTNINEEVFASTSEEKLASFTRYGWNLGLRNNSIAVKKFISKGRPRTLTVDLRWSVDRIADEVYRLLESSQGETSRYTNMG
jgi:glycosyltransferase involved in cell wall biosynthesis